MNVLGNTTKTTFYKRDTHVIHQEFTVKAGVNIEVGMPVKLTADGKIEPFAPGNKFDTLCIGFSLHKRAEGEIATIQMRSRGIIYAQASAALPTGPVKFAGNIAAINNLPQETVNTFATDGVGTDEMIGWAIDAAIAPNEEIRVVLK